MLELTISVGVYSMAKAKLFKEADLVYEDTHPDMPGKIARMVRQSLSGGLGCGITIYEDVTSDWMLTYDEILFMLEGHWRIVVSEDVYDLLPGDVLWLSKNTQVRYEGIGRAKCFWVVYPEDAVQYRMVSNTV